MRHFKLLFLLFAVSIPAFAAGPFIAGLDDADQVSSGGATTVKFKGISDTMYTVVFDRVVAVFSGKPSGKLGEVAEAKADSHGHGRVWLVSAAEHQDVMSGATFQVLGIGKEWRHVLGSAPLANGAAVVSMPFVTDKDGKVLESGWQISTGKIVYPGGAWSWASKGWPHEAYEAYDACGNPVQVWGAGRSNLGMPATAQVKAIIKNSLPCPPGQARKN